MSLVLWSLDPHQIWLILHRLLPLLNRLCYLIIMCVVHAQALHLLHDQQGLPVISSGLPVRLQCTRNWIVPYTHMIVCEPVLHFGCAVLGCLLETRSTSRGHHGAGESSEAMHEAQMSRLDDSLHGGTISQQIMARRSSQRVINRRQPRAHVDLPPIPLVSFRSGRQAWGRVSYASSSPCWLQCLSSVEGEGLQTSFTHS